MDMEKHNWVKHTIPVKRDGPPHGAGDGTNAANITLSPKGQMNVQFRTGAKKTNCKPKNYS